VLEEIGRGGMGVVHKARERPSTASSPPGLRVDQPVSGTDLALRRAGGSARVLHPNIVLVYHAEQLPDALVLILEYVAGVDLGRLVTAEGPLPFALACVCPAGCGGLQHARARPDPSRHQPTNLIVTPAPRPTSPRGCSKILDLGLARLHRRAAAHPSAH
jgi:serine/threonine protein kinase